MFCLLPLVVIILAFIATGLCNAAAVKLGNEVLLEKYYHLIDGKKVGLVTNQTGVDSRGISFIDIINSAENTKLVALYGPEHGIDGTVKAGARLESYIHPRFGIPVYSLYGSTRMPTQAMLQGVDVLLFDIQDIGARTYTYYVHPAVLPGSSGKV